MHDASTGLPGTMLVGVTPTHVCAFDSRSRHKAGPIVFRVPRRTLKVEVHQRVNVRILELVDESSGSRTASTRRTLASTTCRSLWTGTMTVRRNALDV